MHLHMGACNKGKLFYQSSAISKGSCMRDSKIETDRKVCQGYGACIEMCLEPFQLPEADGKSTIGSGKRVKKGSEVVSKVRELDKLESSEMQKPVLSKRPTCSRHVNKGENQLQQRGI